MTISQVHLDFWESKQPRPAWAQKLVSARRKYENSVDPIDACVNAHAGVRHTAAELAASNLLALCYSYRRRGCLATSLRRLSTDPGTHVNAEERRRFARRWARRLERV
jgi:hypothetical protein